MKRERRRSSCNAMEWAGYRRIPVRRPERVQWDDEGNPTRFQSQNVRDPRWIELFQCSFAGRGRDLKLITCGTCRLWPGVAKRPAGDQINLCE